MTDNDRVNHPSHYNSHPSGIEFIEVGRHLNFNTGNAMKYLWRAGLKDEAEIDARAKHIEDLQKAAWYINDEIKRLQVPVVVQTQQGAGQSYEVWAATNLDPEGRLAQVTRTSPEAVIYTGGPDTHSKLDQVEGRNMEEYLRHRCGKPAGDDVCYLYPLHKEPCKPHPAIVRGTQ